MPWIEADQQKSVDDMFSQPFLRHWEHIALNSHQGDPVCCAPVWNLTYHEIFNPGRPIFCLAAEEAILIFEEYITSSGEPCLVPMEDSWMFGQPLLGDLAPALLATVLTALEERYAPAKLALFISGVRETSIFAGMLLNIFGRKKGFYRRAIGIQAAASLSGGLDGWLSRRSANHRAKLRKAERHAREHGVVFERVRPEAANAGNVYARMLAIEAKSWKGIEHCGMAESPSKEYYQSMIARQARAGNAYVIFASLDGEDLGFIYGGCAGSIYRGQQFSYAQEAARLSLGNLLQMEKVRWLCELGISRYDMGPVTGPKMAYKKHWTEEFREVQTWMLR